MIVEVLVHANQETIMAMFLQKVLFSFISVCVCVYSGQLCNTLLTYVQFSRNKGKEKANTKECLAWTMFKRP